MKVIPPLEITDSRLVSSNTAEPGTGESAWSAGTTYALGQQVIRTSTHSIYENVLAGANSGLPENTPTRWLLVGPTNRFAMFDLLRNSQTVAASPLTVKLSAGRRINSLALLGVEAGSATVSMTVGGEVVYSVTRNMSRRTTTTWSAYFYGEFIFKPNLILFDLPLFSNSTVTVTLTSTTGSVKCGACVIGTAVDIGSAEYTAESDALNFSKIDRDTFGNAVLIPRRSVPKTQQTLFLDKEGVNKVIDVRDKLNAVPAVWSGLDDDQDGYFDALLILGIYKQFTVNLAYPDYAKVTLQLEEI
jgi:hypothetical protein